MRRTVHLSQVPDTLLYRHELPVNNMDPIRGRIYHMLLYEAAKAGEVGGDRWDTHDSALCWSVAPGFIIAGEHA